MIRFLFVTLLLLGGCATRYSTGPDDTAWTHQRVTVDDLTLRQQIAQLIMLRVEGFWYSHDNSYHTKLVRWIRDDEIGGLISFRGSVDGTYSNIEYFQRLAKVPLLMAADFERGVGQQVSGATMFPSNMAVAATFDPENAYEQGRITALEARALGVHVAFAPVMDVNNNKDNPIINFRAYSDDPATVSQMGSAFIRGAQDNGLIACAKHYPGHGNTATDSHTSLPLIPGDRAALEAMELKPFQAASDAGVKMFMIGHIAVPGLDASLLPATQSRIMSHDILRDEMGFEGIIVTDGMEMGAITAASWSGEAAIRAIEAGIDMVLLPLHVEGTIDAIEKAVRAGRLTPEQIRESAARVLQTKYDLGLFDERRVISRKKARNVIGTQDHLRIADKIAMESITLVKDEGHQVPLRVRGRNEIFHLLFSMDDDLKERTRPFWSNVERTFGARRVTTKFINEELDRDDIQKLVSQARSSSRVLISALVRIRMDKGVSTIDSSHHELLKALDKAGIQYILISFGSPYLPDLAPIPTYLATYGYGALSMRAAADALFGRAPITGRLPVNLDPQHPRGSGIVRPALTDGFIDGDAGLDFAEVFSILQSAIEDTVMPGAQMFIAVDGVTLLDTGIGYYTYAKTQPVTRASLYDLASVTKVLAGGTVAMKAVEQRYIVLDEPVMNYFPEFRGAGREKITIRHLLTHSSGLPAYERYWRMGIKPEDVLPAVLATTPEFPPGSKYQYSDLGMILFTAVTEFATQQPFDRLAQMWVFDPLRMTHATYNPPEHLQPIIVPTEQDDELRQAIVRGTVHDENTYFMGGVSAHAGVFSNARELAALGLLILNGGVVCGNRVVSQETVDQFIQDQHLPEGSGRALAWQMASSTLHSGDLLSSDAIGHTGFTGTSIWIDPQEQLIIVLLTNRVHPTRERGGIRAVRQQFHNSVVRTIRTKSAGVST